MHAQSWNRFILNPNDDEALVNAKNMNQLEDLLFISRFPANFKEHDAAIARAITADSWEELGILAETPSPSKNRQRAHYQAFETAVNIEEKSYRAIVIQTDHLDKRRTKGIESKKRKKPPAHRKRSKPTKKQPTTANQMPRKH